MEANEIINQTLATYAGLVPVVVALVEVAKGLYLPSNYAPILGIVFGWGLAWVLGAGLVGAILPGVLIGLTASGLYSSVKSFAAVRH